VVLSARLHRAIDLILAGGVIAYPTEGVFGLGCRPDDPRAVLRILELKQRPVTAGLILIAADRSLLADYIAPDAAEERRLGTPTDGPVSWAVTAGPGTAGWITGGRPKVVVRLTSHPVAAALSLGTGLPLVSTSANHRGRDPARSAAATRLRFGNALDLVVGGTTGGARGPSEIRDARSGQVLRRG
jgi:L-threonylcarbamoyladenylate synthase